MMRIIVNVIWIVLGIVVNFLNVDSFWVGMGSSLLVIGTVNLIRMYRIHKNEAYKERVEIELNDERNRYIRSKAWAWAGYLFVMIAAVGSIVLRILKMNTLSIACGLAVLLMIVLFWISYYMLGKKYIFLSAGLARRCG